MLVDDFLIGLIPSPYQMWAQHFEKLWETQCQKPHMVFTK
jgi:hypothetical protein